MKKERYLQKILPINLDRRLPNITDLFTAPLPPPPLTVRDNPVTTTSPQWSMTTLNESTVFEVQNSSAAHIQDRMSPQIMPIPVVVPEDPVDKISPHTTEVLSNGKRTTKAVGADELPTSNPIAAWALFPPLKKEQAKDMITMFTTLPPIVHIIEGQHMHLPNLLPMWESSSEEKIHKTMYTEPLSIELQLNNTITFLRKKTMVDIAIALRSNIIGNYVPYLYLNNIEDHKSYLLCGHLSKSLLDGILDSMVKYVSFVPSAECLFIHAGGSDLFLVFLLPLHPKLLMHLAGRKDILLVAVNHTPCLVITMADFNVLSLKM